MIYANATLEVITEPTAIKPGVFAVHVWGLEPHDQTRDYEITAQSDNIAAQEGIRRFVAEMEASTEV
jgi:hypothetical protein